MLGENIKALRKQKGCSQESLAEYLHVVRQTVSKWENGISVPDAVMLDKIAEFFEVPVSELLGRGICESEEALQTDEIAKQLGLLNDYIVNRTIKRRKIIKRAVIGVIALIIALGAVYMGIRIADRSNETLTTVNLECTLEGETYVYDITYNEQYQIIYAGGDAFIAFHVMTEKCDDANVLIAQIEDYFKDRGGTCEVTEEK